VILSQRRTDVFIDTKTVHMGAPPTNLTITFADYYSKCYYGRSAASTNAKGEVTTHAAGHNHHHKGPAHRCSAEEHGAPDLLMQSRQLLGRDAATKVWPPWLEEISSNFMNWPT